MATTCANARLLICSLLIAIPTVAFPSGSQCYGTVNHGRIENSVKLPSSGPNFSTYSALGVVAGRTYVHGQVAEIIESTYENLRKERPSTVYVYGETGWASGGRFRPHRTHQNGLSVDFFVPVVDAQGKSIPLPTNIFNKFGYGIDFDGEAKFGEYRIDFPALAEHLYRLHLAAKAHKADIALVIFDLPYLPKLFAAPYGDYLEKNLKFLKGKPWVRHDEHYHVDFLIPCKPNTG